MGFYCLTVGAAAQIAATGGKNDVIYRGQDCTIAVNNGEVVITITHTKPRKRQKLFKELCPSPSVAKDGVVHRSQPESGPWVIKFRPK